MKKSKKLLTILGLTAKLCPSYIVLIVFKGIITAATTVFNVLFPKLLIDTLTSTKDVKQVIIYGALIVLNNILLYLFNNFYNAKCETISSYLHHEVKRHLSQKILKIEYSYLEDPYYLDLKDKAIFAINNQDTIEHIVNFFTLIVTQATTIITLVAILATLGPVMLIIIALCVLLNLFIYKWISKDMVWLQTNLIPINRKYGYYWRICQEKQNQKDIRLYNMQDMFASRVKNYGIEICKPFMNFYNKLGVNSGFMDIISVFLSSFAYLYIGIRTVSNILGSRISLGSLTMYVNSAITLTGLISTFGSNIVNLGMETEFMDPYIEFMSLKEAAAPEGKEIFDKDIETIEFEDVSFAYPKAKKETLSHVSFRIEKGQKISIVGLNGAGKSTLVKLICRMYNPTSGKIKINGKDINDYEYNSYMKAVSAVFQDYKIFNFTVAENISCMDKDENRLRIEELIDEVGLRGQIDSLPKGIDSQFGKEYDEDGIELSGGQSQKIAIARSLYKKASLVILDEPASALDPISEAEIYEKFNTLVKDKTAVYISHRMSSSVFCDKILIIDGGTVADFDTHQNLMQKKESLYYKLFMSQAENYRLKEEDKVLQEV